MQKLNKTAPAKASAEKLVILFHHLANHINRRLFD